MIEKVTQAIIQRIPNAQITWWKDRLWFFKVKVSDSIRDRTFLTMAHALEGALAVKYDPYIQQIQAEDIAFLIYSDYQRWVSDAVCNRETIARIYVIYDHPKDYPNKWVVRGWEVINNLPQPQPDAEPILCKTVEEAREHIRNLIPHALLIQLNDPDPHIAEVWG